MAKKNVTLLTKAFLSVVYTILNQPEKPITEYQEIDETDKFYDFLESDFDGISLFDFLVYPDFEGFAASIANIYCAIYHCVSVTQLFNIVGHLQYLDSFLQKTPSV